MIDLEKKYSEIIEQLISGKRPQIILSQEEINSLVQIWLEINEKRNKEQFKKILCILDNTRTLSLEFKESLYNSFEIFKDEQSLVFLLGASRKHIIECSHKNGDRVELQFLNILKGLLSHKNPEILEWTLRLIESLGSQAIFLKDDIIKSKPGILGVFNQHKKASREIIELIEKRWTRK